MKTKKLMKASSLCALLLCGAMNVSAQEAITFDPANFTTPAWTKIVRLSKQLEGQNSKKPYSINMTINGDPTTRMAFAWFTNPEVTTGMVQIVEGKDATDFTNATVINATSKATSLNYAVDDNELEGIEIDTKKDYMSHKALATGLKPATTYTYRVGNAEGWSETGTFTTAAESYKDGFSFIYITDTQAENDFMFNVSQQTLHTALDEFPETSFVLCNGDLVETTGTSGNSSEWENEQWFETMQDIWMNYPLAVTMGNHDRSQYNNNNNFYWHFNNDTTFNQTSKVPLTMPGTVFSFVHGDALFLMLSFEDYSKEGLLDELEKWIRNEVAEHPNVKWRFASFHKNMFTGSRSHQSDKDGKIIREKFLPIFNELHIHFALQGHDHIYEVIGPVTNDKTLVDGAVEKVETVEPSGVRENMTGKSGGVFNVNKGTLYFLNNSAGVKKYEPRSEDDMIDAFEDHNVENYWGLFSGKFGQTGEPTFSHITVKSDSIFVDTYTVNTAANAELFDSFIIINKEGGADNVQSDSETNRIKIYFNKNTKQIVVEGIDAEQVDVFSANGAIVNSTSEEAVNASGLTNGLYIVKAKKGNDNYFGKVMVE